jgi:hypothetical protein
MRNDNEQVSSFDAIAARPAWNGLDERSANEKDGIENSESAGTPTQKKPYGKPSYRFERVFETMALSCGKISATQFECRFHRRNS